MELLRFNGSPHLTDRHWLTTAPARDRKNEKRTVFKRQITSVGLSPPAPSVLQPGGLAPWDYGEIIQYQVR